MYQFAVYVHILSIVCWLGSAVFIALILAPALRADETRAAARTVLSAGAGRLRAMAWICMLNIVFTGGYLMSERFGSALGEDGFWGTTSGKLLILKLLGIGTIIVLSAWHDFVHGPKAVRLMRDDPTGPATRRSRLIARLIGMVNLLIGLVLILVGVLIVRPS